MARSAQRVTTATIAETISAETLRAMGLPLSLSAAQPSSAKLPGAFRLKALPPGDLQGATITLTSGASAGAEVQIAGVFDDLVVLGYGQDVSKLASIQPGDEVHVDNAVYLAIQSYHRHTVPGAEYKVYDQYRDTTGKPLLPQRDNQTSTLVNQAGMMRNGGETDVDCGGPCAACSDGKACTLAQDCQSNLCLAGTCARL